MGTRATITFTESFDGTVTPIWKLYVQFDGYWSHLGKKLAEFVSSRPIVNGMRDRFRSRAEAVEAAWMEHDADTVRQSEAR
jgi:hypothetical protein